MADSKITALTALTAADPANDMIPIVDVSDTPPASGNTKRISINNLLACSPSATLASATITGDLTVDTSTLKVDSANNRVGIGTATPGYDLEIAGAVRSSLAIRGNFAGGTDIAHLRFVNANGSVVADIFSQNTNGGASDSAYLSFNTTSSGTSAERYRIGSDGTSTWSVGGSTAMTLNANGLGIGVSPTEALTVRSSAAGAMGRFHSTNVNGPYVIFQNSTGNFGDIGSELAITGGGSAGNLTLNSRSTSNLCFAVSDSVKMRIDSSGNVGIGVTPVNMLTIGTGTFNASTVSGSSSLYSTVAQGLVILADGLAVATRGGVNKLIANSAGDIISSVTGTAPSLTDNGYMVFNLTSNTNLRVSVRGSDGVTRTANLTLA